MVSNRSIIRLLMVENGILRGTIVIKDHGTIHQTTELDVEVDEKGKVVSVWFRCMALPFREIVVGENRAEEMCNMYGRNVIPELVGVDVNLKD